MVLPVVMYGCETWTIKKAEYWRIDAFELWCWRRLLWVPWTARRSNQSILKKISPEYSLEGLMLKLKLQYFGHLMRKTDSLEKTPMLGKIEGSRRRGWHRWDVWMASLLNGHEFEQALGVGEWTGKPGMLQSMGSQGIGHDWVTELNWYLHHLLLPFGYINMKNIMQWNSRRSISLTEEHLIIFIRYTFFFLQRVEDKMQSIELLILCLSYIFT